MTHTRIYILIIAFLTSVTTKAQDPVRELSVNYRYAPSWWQTLINHPESPRKTLVDKQGELMYEYPVHIPNVKASHLSGFNTIVSFEGIEDGNWKDQQLLTARVPIVITQKESNGISVKEEAFTVAPLLFGDQLNELNEPLGTYLSQKISGKPGNDIVIITVKNNNSSSVNFSPKIKITTVYPATIDTAKGKVFVSDFLRVSIPYAIVKTSSEIVKKAKEKNRNQITLSIKPIELGAGEKIQLTFGVSHGYSAIDCPNNLKQALHLQQQTIAWWEKQGLPFNQIAVPDQDIQNLLNSSIRNIYQTIDPEKDLKVLRTGPSSNRQFFISDAPFIIDALTMLNRKEDAKSALQYMFGLQNSDGSFLQQEKDWKETGLALWAIANYARLTGDKEWLDSSWPILEKGYNFLTDLQKSTMQNNKLPYAGMLPPSDASEGQLIDYVNNYWALAGLNSAISAARWVGRNGQAIKWQSSYDDYYKTFLASVEKNLKKDSYGNKYLPARSPDSKNVIPQKSQWAFLNAVYPGKVFDMNNPLLTGNMKMLEKSVKEGLLFNTGWLNNGIVLTTASDYAHALQWTGHAQKAAEVMYAMANHAAPNYSWFEQQTLKGVADSLFTGDMPNNRTSAEFIRLVRHLIVIERGYELHLFEGVPGAWTKPGMEIKLENVLTEFGPLKFLFKVSNDGTSATIDMDLDSNNRRAPQRIIFHLDGLSGNPATIELEQKPKLHKVLKLD